MRVSKAARLAFKDFLSELDEGEGHGRDAAKHDKCQLLELASCGEKAPEDGDWVPAFGK